MSSKTGLGRAWLKQMDTEKLDTASGLGLEDVYMSSFQTEGLYKHDVHHANKRLARPVVLHAAVYQCHGRGKTPAADRVLAVATVLSDISSSADHSTVHADLHCSTTDP